jgi:hypothetical protein
MQTALISNKSISGATDLLPSLIRLEQHEKLFLIQFLAAELSRHNQSFSISEQVYPIWSPVDSFGAAETMLQALRANRAEKS